MPNWRGPKTTALDAAPPFPTELRYLWTWFSEHCFGLQAGGMAVPSVTWEGLAAWCELMDIALLPWEAQTMVRLGNVRAAELSKPSQSIEASNGAAGPHRTGGKKHRGDHPR